MSNRNVPKLRLDRFKGEWERQNVASISKRVTRVTPSSTAPVMMISAASGFIPQSNKYSSDNAGKSLSNYIELHQDELAYNHGASKLRQFGSCFRLDVPAARVPFVYHCFQVLEDDPTFVGFSLNRDSVQEQLRRLVSSGARMDGLLNISFEQYGTVEISLPPTLEEQQAIGVVFTNLDAVIDQHTDKHRVLQRTKTALMQKMFPQDGQTEPELRLDGFEGEWDSRPIASMAEVITGTTPPTQDARNYGAHIPFLGPADLEPAREITVGKKYLSEQGLQLARDIPPGATLLVCIGSIGKVGQCSIPVTTNQQINAVIPSDSRVNDFLFTRIESAAADIIAGSSTQTMPIINKSKLESFPLDCPPTVEEQQAIGAVFTKLDTLISAEAQFIEKLKQTKTALLQKMFV